MVFKRVTIFTLLDMNLCKLWEIVRTGKPGMLQLMGMQSVRHDLVTEQQQCALFCFMRI